MKSLAAVVIPTRNRAQHLAPCLASVAIACERVRSRRPVEVIVVDDGSVDGTADLIADALRQGLVDRALRSSSPRGPAGARNLGWRATEANIIAFTDDDCRVEHEWLGALLGAVEAAPGEVAGVGGRVLPARPGFVADYMTLHGILEPPASRAYVVTANCALRRDAIDKVGGFDEAVRAPGGEDPGLCLALRRLGYRFDLEDRAVVRHVYREGVREFLSTFYRYGKGCRIVMDS